LGDSLSSKPSKKKNKGVTVSLRKLMVGKLAGRQAAELVHGQCEADDEGVVVTVDGATGAWEEAHSWSLAWRELESAAPEGYKT
jgi:hypothetical protein